MKLETLLKLLVKQQNDSTVEYLLMSQHDELERYTTIQYTIPANLVVEVFMNGKFAKTDLIEITRMFNDNDTYTDVVIIQNCEDRENPENFEVFFDIPVRIYQLVDIK